MKRPWTLPFIANELFPEHVQEITATSGEAEARARAIRDALFRLRQDTRENDASLQRLHGLSARLEVGAKDAQNLMERSLDLSHTFVPLIESAYPCPGADAARLAAHRLHLAVGSARAALGGRLDDLEASARHSDAPEEVQLADGAADVLARMQHSLAEVAGVKHGQHGGAWKPFVHHELVQSSAPPLMHLVLPKCREGARASSSGGSCQGRGSDTNVRRARRRYAGGFL